MKQELLATLAILVTRKPVYRCRYLEKAGLGEYTANNPYIQELCTLGFIQIRSNGSIVIDDEYARNTMKDNKAPTEYSNYIRNMHLYFAE